MAAPNTAWGIEIGAYAIKAIRLERDGDRVRVVDFSVIPHKKVLSTPDLDQNEMIRLGLGQFISQKALEGEHLVMSVPGHAAFARFAKLPPVEPKKVPDIVKFEAVQQIPFPIEEVEWDYQTFMHEDSPEVEVGIFAMTRERVAQRLALYSELGITPEVLTLSPVAVYNAMNYDHDLEQRKKAVIYLDIGTSATDLIVANDGACWIRTFPLGGTHFTEAISEAFKLSYSKAEKLKQEASTSKYAKQIMQAMRPVFTDLLQDVQRSIGYYQSVHRDAELGTMVGLGSTFKIPGLRKFLGQQLQMEVVRLDEYRKVRVEGREAASFSENAVNFATAYGLALQGVGLGTIDANLVPVQVLREQVWHSKIKWFAAAAAIAIVGGGITFYRPMTDQSAVTGSVPSSVTGVLNRGRDAVRKFDENKSLLATVGHKASNVLRLTEHRRIWPLLVEDVAASLRSTNPQPELISGDLSDVMRIDPGDRRLISLTKLEGDYRTEAAAAGGTPGEPRRLIDVRMEVVLTHDNPVPFVSDTVQEWLRTNADLPNRPYRIVESSINLNPSLFKTEKTPPRQAGDSGDSSSGGGGSRIDRPNRPDGPNRPTNPNQPNQPGGGGGGGAPIMPGGGGGGGAPIMPGGGGGGGAPIMPGGGGGGSGMPVNPGGGGGGSGMPVSPPGGGGGGGGGGSGGGGLNLDSPDPNLKEIEALAPVSTPPDILPPETPYYRMIITFTVELRKPLSELPNIGDTALGNTSDEGAGS